MRNYALFRAQNEQMAIVGAGRLVRMWRNWKARQRVRQLTELDDVILRDIGITRDEIDRVRHLSLDNDPAAELARVRQRDRSTFWKI
jgi:uncharacterized protein YjiS (DUF1127 family)